MSTPPTVPIDASSPQELLKKKKEEEKAQRKAQQEAARAEKAAEKLARVAQHKAEALERSNLAQQRKEANILKSQEQRAQADKKRAEKKARAEAQAATNAEKKAKEVVLQLDWEDLGETLKKQLGLPDVKKFDALGRLPIRVPITLESVAAVQKTRAMGPRSVTIQLKVSVQPQAHDARAVWFWPLNGTNKSVSLDEVRGYLTSFGSVESAISMGGLFVITFETVESRVKALEFSAELEKDGQELRFEGSDTSFHYLQPGVPTTTRQSLERKRIRSGAPNEKRQKSALSTEEPSSTS